MTLASTSFLSASKVSNSDDSLQAKNEAKEIITVEDEDEDPDTILTELGLSQQDFPSLQSKANAAKAKMSGAGAQDTSLIMICGTDVQSFANMLYESVTKIASAKTGRLAGLPPTILSPVAFAGSTLTPFKIKHVRNKGSGPAAGFIETFDIIGPILPTNVTALVKQFRSLPLPEDHCSVTATVNLITEENSTPFASVSSLSPAVPSEATGASAGASHGGGVFLQQSLSDSGIPEEMIAQLCSQPDQARRPLKEVIFCPQHEYLSYT